MTDRQVRSEQAKPGDAVDGCAAAAATRIYLLEERLAEIRILPITIPDMIANRDAHLGAIADAIRLCAGDALLGGAPLAGLGTKMSEETGVTVLDGVEASVAAAMRISGSGV